MKHEPIVILRRRQRLLAAFAWAMAALALWSIVGAIIALEVDDAQAAWDFVWSLLGSGATLVVISLYEGRAR